MQQKIFIHGEIITADARSPRAEAVVVRDGTIIYAGDSSTAEEYRPASGPGETEVIDLEGRAMLPGFIDSHSHFLMAAAIAAFPILSSPPIGPVESIGDILRVLEDEIREKRIPEGKLVIGWGFDESLLRERRAPTNRELDRISQSHPIYIVHQSGHKGVGNSLLLKRFGIDESAPDPEGGHIGRWPGTMIPNGTLEEKSSMAVLIQEMTTPDPSNIARNLRAAGELYASNGITTAQEGALQPSTAALGQMAGTNGLLAIDLTGYLLISSLDDFPAVDRAIAAGDTGPYRGRFRIGGAKLLLDGSPQAKTAWLSQPYLVPPPGEDASYRGYPFYTRDAFVTSVYEGCLRRNLQILTHTNGDQACEQFITCFGQARRNTGITADIRPVMIHAQTVREDQLDRMKELGIRPSFFQSHTYFWGDWHLESVLGEERGMRISPIRSAIDRGLPCTMHQDTPVVPPDMLFTLWTAVNRTTRSGRIIGADQRIGIMEAIEALTINGARQYFEEDTKGSITPGKRADLVILDRSPLEVEPDALKEIVVLETIKDGQTIYRRG